MSEERFWNTDESISTAKFAVPDGAIDHATGRAHLPS